jgi:multidrug efflux pump subunit AcrB
MSLSSIFISRPITVLMYYIGVVILGVVAFLNLSIDFLWTYEHPWTTRTTSSSGEGGER